jgi:hypothetical protein
MQRSPNPAALPANYDMNVNLKLVRSIMGEQGLYGLAHPLWRLPNLGKLRLRPANPMVEETAPPGLARRPPTPHRSRWPLQPRLGTHQSVPLPRQQDPQPLDPGQPRLTADTVGSLCVPLTGSHDNFLHFRTADHDRTQRWDATMP